MVTPPCTYDSDESEDFLDIVNAWAGTCVVGLSE